MGEHADEAIERAMDQMERVLARASRKQQRIREAVLKEDRQIRAMIAKDEYCLDQLPDLEDEDDGLIRGEA